MRNDSERANGSPPRPKLGGRLLLGVNSSLALVLGVFMIWDYHVGSQTLLAEKKTALVEEAKTLLPAVERLREHGTQAVQAYVDEVCGAMQDAASPGHHIALRMGDEVLQAHAHHRASPAILFAMEQGAEREDGVGRAEGREVVAGSAAKGDTVVYVSEYLDNIKRTLRATMLRRLLGILSAGVVLAVVLNVVLHRLLVTPLGEMVNTVRQLGPGRYGVRMPRARTLELGILADEFDHMAESLQRAQRDQHRRLEHARAIQENLLPEARELPGLRFACVFAPAAEVAGDYYDILPMRDGGALFCIADVTGHGVAAAMGAAMLKALLQTAQEIHEGPAGLLDHLDEAFSRVALADDFATMALARWCPADHVLHWASAGQETAYLLRTCGDTEHLEATGVPLGATRTPTTWDCVTLPVAPGDRLIMVTDGFAEASSPNGEQFTRQRVADVIEEHRGDSMEDLAKALGDAVAAHCGDSPQVDDMTLLLAEF